MNHKFKSGDYVYIKSMDSMGYVSSYLDGFIGDWYKVVYTVNTKDDHSASILTAIAECDLVLLSRDTGNESLVSSQPLNSLFEVGVCRTNMT